MWRSAAAALGVSPTHGRTSGLKADSRNNTVRPPAAPGLNARVRAGRRLVDLLGRERAREVVALTECAAQLEQSRPLRLGFDAFGHDVHVEGAAEAEDGASEGGVVAPLRANAQLVDERLVDLQHVHRETLEVAERRKAGPEVVD